MLVGGTTEDESLLTLLDLESQQCLDIPFPADDAVGSISLLSFKRDAHNPNEPCILAGFRSGFVRFYSKDGHLIVQWQLHDTPVTYLSVSPPACDMCDLLVQHGLVVVRLPGVPLSVALREAMRAPGSTDQTPPDHCKWKLHDQASSAACVALGRATRPAPALPLNPPRTALLSVGRRPVIALFEAGQSSNVVSAVKIATQVASKLTKSVFSFAKSFFRSVPEPEPTPPAAVEPVEVQSELRFSDAKRHASTLSMSPCGQFAAAGDHLGRVILYLVKPQYVCALYVWKGYRDAQFAWLVEDNPSGRDSLYLALYVPFRELLEVWSVPQFDRVAASVVGRGLLVSAPPPLLDQPFHSYPSSSSHPSSSVSSPSLSVPLGPFSPLLHSRFPTRPCFCSDDGRVLHIRLPSKASP